MRFLTPAICILFVALVAFAQSNAGTISGFVSEATRGPVPGASIQAKNTENGTVYRTVTGLAGNYTLSQLSAGKYELSVTSVGFKPYERKDIVIQAGQTLRIDVPLGDFISSPGRKRSESDASDSARRRWSVEVHQSYDDSAWRNYSPRVQLTPSLATEQDIREAMKSLLWVQAPPGSGPVDLQIRVNLTIALDRVNIAPYLIEQPCLAGCGGGMCYVRLGPGYLRGAPFYLPALHLDGKVELWSSQIESSASSFQAALFPGQACGDTVQADYSRLLRAVYDRSGFKNLFVGLVTQMDRNFVLLDAQNKKAPSSRCPEFQRRFERLRDSSSSLSSTRRAVEEELGQPVRINPEAAGFSTLEYATDGCSAFIRIGPDGTVVSKDLKGSVLK